MPAATVWTSDTRATATWTSDAEVITAWYVDPRSELQPFTNLGDALPAETYLVSQLNQELIQDMDSVLISAMV